MVGDEFVDIEHFCFSVIGGCQALGLKRTIGTAFFCFFFFSFFFFSLRFLEGVWGFERRAAVDFSWI